VPAYFIAVLFEHQDNASYQYGVGRLAFITAMVVVILYVYRLVHRDGVMVKHLVLRYPGSLITRVHLLLGAVAVLLPVSFALLASVGYYYTALNLNRYLMQTGFLIIVAIVVRSLAMRWLMLAESKLALKRARARREAASDAGAGEGDLTELSDDDVPIDIATINSQTRMMLSNLIGWSFAVGLYFIWQGALPALGILESIDLWEIEVLGSDGADFQSITLATVLLAAIIVAVTSIAAKNLPGVLEIGLLQRLPLQPGSRYAITTFSQYAITAIGIILVLSVLGARW
jgi:potassium efflux system protein